MHFFLNGVRKNAVSGTLRKEYILLRLVRNAHTIINCVQNAFLTK